MLNSREREYLNYNLKQEQAALNDLKKLYKQALDDIDNQIALLMGRQDTENLASIIYQLDYQKALKKQVGAILDVLHTKEYSRIEDYLKDCYENGFLGTMYNLHGQGIPLVLPIDQEQVLNALTIDSKLSKNLYDSLGEDITSLKRKVQSEISRGIANNYSFSDIARNLSNISRAGMYNAYRIARTEGHRIQNQSAMDAVNKAKEKGADVVKQWDSTLDKKTRPHHVQLDGQIKEVEEPFEVAGRKAMCPGGFGIASEDIHCRCQVLQRARWAIDDESENTKWDNENKEFIKIDSKNYQDFKKKYQDVLTNNVKNDIKKVNSLNEFKLIQGEHTREADMKATNPKFSTGKKEYTHNCQRCVSTYEARRRGYDVTAKPRIFDGTDTLPYMTHQKGWAAVYKDYELVKCSSNTGVNTGKKVIEQMEKWGNGSRAIVRVQWKSGGGHVFIAEQVDGKTIFIDPQTNKNDVEWYFNSAKKTETYVMRIDNLEFTDLIKECCE